MDFYFNFPTERGNAKPEDDAVHDPMFSIAAGWRNIKKYLAGQYELPMVATLRLPGEHNRVAREALDRLIESYQRRYARPNDRANDQPGESQRQPRPTSDLLARPLIARCLHHVIFILQILL